MKFNSCSYLWCFCLHKKICESQYYCHSQSYYVVYSVHRKSHSYCTPQNYYVESIKSLQALVIVQHTNGQHNLYLSEETGQHFSLSLPDLVIANNALDLELVRVWHLSLLYSYVCVQVDSMNATYIANQNIGSSIRTLISFDNGGNWQLLRPPALTSCQPVSVTIVWLLCPHSPLQPSCSLHLHMSSSQYWRTGVYSQQSAPGIIIAHGTAILSLAHRRCYCCYPLGTTGASLSSDPDLYVRPVGGINWRQVSTLAVTDIMTVSVVCAGTAVQLGSDSSWGAFAKMLSIEYMMCSCV